MALRTQALYLDPLVGDSAIGIADKQISFRYPLHLAFSLQRHTTPSTKLTLHASCWGRGGHLLI